MLAGDTREGVMDWFVYGAGLLSTVSVVGGLLNLARLTRRAERREHAGAREHSIEERIDTKARVADETRPGLGGMNREERRRALFGEHPRAGAGGERTTPSR